MSALHLEKDTVILQEARLCILNDLYNVLCIYDYAWKYSRALTAVCLCLHLEDKFSELDSTSPIHETLTRIPENPSRHR